MTFIAVIIPVRDDDLVFCAVRSVLECDYPQECYQIIIVDNGSESAFLDRLEAGFSEERAVTVLNELSEGSYIARNAGLHYAEKKTCADVFALIDSDCVVEPGWLNAIDRVFGAPEVDAVMGRSGGINANIVALCEQRMYEKIVKSFTGKENLRRIDTRNFALRRRAFKKAGVFLPVKYGGDMEYGARLHLNGLKTIYETTMYVRHRNPTDFPRLLEKRVRQNHGNQLLIEYCDESILQDYLPDIYKHSFEKTAPGCREYCLWPALILAKYVAFPTSGYVVSALSRVSLNSAAVYFEVMVKLACHLGKLAYRLGRVP